MFVPRLDAVLDLVLLEAISNMGIAKNSALAHALVSLGSHTIADASWLTINDVLLSLLIPSLDDPTITMEIGTTHFRGVQFMVFYINETRQTNQDKCQKSEAYNHEGLLVIQDQRMWNFEPPKMLQKKPDEVTKAFNSFLGMGHLLWPTFLTSLGR